MAASTDGRSPRSDWQQVLGGAAEELAERHLAARGCRILARRYRAARGEVDLVVRDGDVVAFVEVKARRGAGLAAAAAAVTRDKQSRVASAARAFLRQRRLGGVACRFDVVAVDVGGGRARVAWLRDAFRL